MTETFPVKKMMTLAFLISPALLASTQESDRTEDDHIRAKRPFPLHMITWQEIKDGEPIAPPQGQFVQAGENMWVFEPPTPYPSPALKRRNSR